MRPVSHPDGSLRVSIGITWPSFDQLHHPEGWSTDAKWPGFGCKKLKNSALGKNSCSASYSNAPWKILEEKADIELQNALNNFLHTMLEYVGICWICRYDVS